MRCFSPQVGAFQHGRMVSGCQSQRVMRGAEMLMEFGDGRDRCSRTAASFSVQVPAADEAPIAGACRKLETAISRLWKQPPADAGRANCERVTSFLFNNCMCSTLGFLSAAEPGVSQLP